MSTVQNAVTLEGASPAANKAFVELYLEAISGKPKPADLLRRFVAASDADLIEHIEIHEAAFPNYELIAEDIIAEGDKVVVRFFVRGTHLGTYMGLAPTGRKIDAPGIIIYRIADGKIVEHWLQVDAMTVMQQLGLAG